MTDLHELLDVASRTDTDRGHGAGWDVSDTLRLGRRALVRRRVVAVGGGLAAASVLVTLTGALLTDPSTSSGPVRPAGSTATQGSTLTPDSTPSPRAVESTAPTTPLLDTPAQAGPFRFAMTPRGWVAGVSADYVGNLVPAAGGTSRAPDDPGGKISAVVHDRPGDDTMTANVTTLVAQRPITAKGRTMSLVVQVPLDLNLSPDDVKRLVDGITVGDSVEPVLG